MNGESAKSGMAKSWVFFEKARSVAEKGNYDYAIDMYIDGLRCAPESVLDGHTKLHSLALERQEKGGKKPTMMERVKRLRGKRQEPLEQMLSAEYLFAKDPSNISYGESMLKAAIAGEFKDTARWVADLLFQMNNTARKPSFHTYILLKDSYSQIQEFDRALLAIQCAIKLRPEDGDLADEYKRLSAELTLARGKYDQEGDFRHSIKDRELQEKLQSQESVVKTEDYRITAVRDAREALAKEPDLPRNIYNLAQALLEMEDEDSENEAIELLEKTYLKKSDFSYKQKAGQIKINQLKRKLRDAKFELEVEPDNAEVKAAIERLGKQLNEASLEHYRLCVENYPTDLQAKYEYANSLVENKQYDDAIPLYQEAQKDPRHRITSMGKIGLCFYLKGWYADAIDVFKQAIDSYEIKEDNVAKELRYNLGKAYEASGEENKALEIYRKIAQLDFAYRNVRQRVDQLRKKKQEG